MTRQWTQTTTDDRTEWRGTDDKALVAVYRTPEGWRTEVYEATGRDTLDAPASYVGSEPVSPYRSGATTVARRWVRRLSRPQK